MNIPKWDEYFFGLAEAASKRATCLRTQVGCVIVKNRHVLSTGYNGAPSGREDCVKKGFCHRDKVGVPSGTKLEECYASGAHSEVNAIYLAARHGISVEGATLYLIGHDIVCSWCQSAILNSGIEKVMLKNRKGEVKTFYPRADFIRHPILPEVSYM